MSHVSKRRCVGCVAAWPDANRHYTCTDTVGTSVQLFSYAPIAANSRDLIPVYGYNCHPSPCSQVLTVNIGPPPSLRYNLVRNAEATGRTPSVYTTPIFVVLDPAYREVHMLNLLPSHPLFTKLQTPSSNKLNSQHGKHLQKRR